MSGAEGDVESDKLFGFLFAREEVGTVGPRRKASRTRAARAEAANVNDGVGSATTPGAEGREAGGKAGGPAAGAGDATLPGAEGDGAAGLGTGRRRFGGGAGALLLAGRFL